MLLICNRLGWKSALASSVVFASTQLAGAAPQRTADSIGAIQPHPPAYTYHLYDQPHPLTLDSSRIAVLIAEDAGPQQAAALLEQWDLQAETLEPQAVPGWWLAQMQPQRAGDIAIRETALAMADNPAITFVSPVFLDDDGEPFMVTPTLLIRFHPSISRQDAEAVIEADADGEILDRDWANLPNAYRVRSNAADGFAVLEAANRLALRPETRFAEPDWFFRGRGSGQPVFPNDTWFSQQWGLHNAGQHVSCNVSWALPGIDIRAPWAWKTTTGSDSIIVMVIDDGVQLNHPDFNINNMLGEDFTGQNGGGYPVNQCDNHGTPVAGIIAAVMNNNLGIAGVAPGSILASARPFISHVDNPCGNSWSGFGSWSVNALAWAETIGVRITNNSNSYGGAWSAALIDKYQQTRDDGMIHFASAGNNGSPNISVPAAHPAVNAVAALDRNGQLASFSNWGVGLAFSAPGRGIWSTDRTDGGYTGGHYTCFGGTSAASPMAAGVAALLLSHAPHLSADEAEDILAASATDLGSPGYNTTFGWGLVNAQQAIADAPPCAPADLNCDGVVDGADLLILLSAWGECDDCDDCLGNLNDDCVIDGADLLVLLSNWG